MDKNDIKTKIAREEDFIYAPKFGNSLSRFLNKNPDGLEDADIAKLLLMTPEEINKIYQEAIKELREEMGV